MHTYRTIFGLLLIFSFAGAASAQGEKTPVDAPVPKPDSGVDDSKDKNEPKNDVVIECQGRAFFDNAEHTVIFQEDVIVRHPSFLIECEELDIHLKGDVTSALGAGSTPPPAETTAEGAAAKKPQDQIKKLYAWGKDRLVALRKKSPQGDVFAKAGRASYDGETEDIILLDWPVVNRNGVSVQATEKGTMITIKKLGDFEVLGPAIFRKSAEGK